MTNYQIGRFEKIATKVRETLGFADTGFVDAIELLDRAVRERLIAQYDVVADESLPTAEARWNPKDDSITLRQSIYSNAAAEETRARFVIAHELAHAVLKHPVRNRRVGGAAQFGRFVAAHELEADELAAAILAPTALLDMSQHPTPRDVANEFGLPIQIAEELFKLLQSGPQHAAHRRSIVPRERRVVIIDTGDYEDAFWAMSRNAQKV